MPVGDGILSFEMYWTRRQCLTLLGSPLMAAEKPLAGVWQEIAATSDGTVGASALHLESGRSASLHGAESFPLASVCKVPIAMHFLKLVEEGKFALGQEIEIPPQDLVPGVSPVAERWPKQKRFRLDELLELMVAKSDNTVVETLYRLGGGAPALAARFREWHSEGVRIDRSERECGLNAAGIERIPPREQWTAGMYDELTAKIPPAARRAAMLRFLADPRDTATPDGTVRLLERAFKGELLSAASTARLKQIMEATTTGPKRIKGLLPPGTVVAHKTGTTGTAKGLNGSTNDVGVITLPGGAGKIAIAVYVKASSRDLENRERVIARIAQAAWARFRAG